MHYTLRFVMTALLAQSHIQVWTWHLEYWDVCKKYLVYILSKKHAIDYITIGSIPRQLNELPKEVTVMMAVVAVIRFYFCKKRKTIFFITITHCRLQFFVFVIWSGSRGGSTSLQCVFTSRGAAKGRWMSQTMDKMSQVCIFFFKWPYYLYSS